MPVPFECHFDYSSGILISCALQYFIVHCAHKFQYSPEENVFCQNWPCKWLGVLNYQHSVKLYCADMYLFVNININIAFGEQGGG